MQSTPPKFCRDGDFRCTVQGIELSRRCRYCRVYADKMGLEEELLGLKAQLHKMDDIWADYDEEQRALEHKRVREQQSESQTKKAKLEENKKDTDKDKTDEDKDKADKDIKDKDTGIGPSPEDVGKDESD